MATSGNPQNVSFGKGLSSGCVYRAPTRLVTDDKLPKDAATPLDAIFKPCGLIGEDGITNSSSTDTTSVTDMDGNTVMTVVSSYSETYEIPFLELNEQVLKAYYGEDNVTVDDAQLDELLRKYTAWHTFPDTEPTTYVLERLITGNRVKRTVIDRGTLNSRGDIQEHSSDPVIYDVTLNANASSRIPSPTGQLATSVDYIAPIATTPAGTLTALTVTAAPRTGGQTITVTQTAGEGLARVYRIDDAGKEPAITYDVELGDPKWVAFPANGQVTGAEGQIASVADITTDKHVRAYGKATLPAAGK
ncbi:phage major tail protein [Bifidobacterium callitrichos DSM 23973]|uniref:Phage major tail protein n=1 Tax=Bifidobacterium callitrichos DSM 23973 TaxID=1437609 RepID=A0A087ACT4_9BIFI|nr:hypothetical protein [Bifidobacterium callitrichos]KFI56584.1 phage major tail protein [Bifidobacterium callitrichos DSM 23973]